MTESSASPVVIVMGVSGSGKTTVGRALAAALGWAFSDADDYHSLVNVEKMRQSIALTTADRGPWLDALIARLNQEPRGRLVLACSALTRAIRQRFRDEVRAPVVFVYLKLDRARLERRLLARQGHFAKAGLLASQLATLEEPHNALVIDAEAAPDVVTARVCAQLPLGCPARGSG